MTAVCTRGSGVVGYWAGDSNWSASLSSTKEFQRSLSFSSYRKTGTISVCTENKCLELTFSGFGCVHVHLNFEQ